jgi:hypothetical protein
MSEAAQETFLSTLSEDAQRFKASKLGIYLDLRAKEVLAEALEGLKKVDPEDKKTITRLQSDAWKAESFMDWLDELIEADNAGAEAVPDYDE